MGERIKFGWAGGVNLIVDPANIRPDQLADGKNCWPTLEGVLAKRHVVKSIGTLNGQTGGGSVVGHYPLTLFKPDPNSGYDYILNALSQANGLEILVAARVGENYFIPPGTSSSPWVSVQLVTAYPAGPSVMCNFDGRTLAVSGLEGFFQFYKDGDTWNFRRNSFAWPADTAGVTVAQAQIVPIQPKVCGSYRGRMVYGNLGPGYENCIILADRTPPVGWANVIEAPPWAIVGDDVLAANGRHLRFSSIQGETIRCVREVSMSSATQPLQTALLILTERSAIICTGETAESTAVVDSYSGYLADFQFAKVNYDCGIAGPYAICTGPNGTFWASGEEVYALYDGQPRPLPIGTNIRPALQSCPPNLQPFWHMAYTNGAVTLAVPTQDSSWETLLSIEHWRLDLRPPGGNDVAARPSGPSEARWYGPMDYSGLQALGGSGDDSVNNERGSLACCVVADRNKDGRPVLRGAWRGDRNVDADKGTFVISFDEVFGGRDIPYQEVAEGRTWTASEFVSVGQVVMPTPRARNGRLYAATTAGGNTGATEPTWPTTDGGTVVDGAVTWTELTGVDNARPPSHYGSTVEPVAMEPHFMEYSLGTNTQEKIFKRADISAHVSIRQLLWLDCALNGGNLQGWMGPCTIGGPSGIRTPANNELGTMLLGTSALAQEYQARTMRGAQGVDRELYPIYLPAAVRGRDIQPRLMEGSGFLVDETNDYIVWGSFNPSGATTLQLRQGQITHGYYPNANSLIAAILSVLNAQSTLTGFTTGANPWSSEGAFATDHPYMTQLAYAFSARTAGTVLGFVAGVDLDEDEAIDNSVLYYVNRSARLLAMLGYDTSDAYSTASTYFPILSSGFVCNLIGEQTSPLLVSTTRICGVQSIPYYRSAVVAISELEGEFHLKRGRPFSKSNRIS